MTRLFSGSSTTCSTSSSSSAPWMASRAATSEARSSRSSASASFPGVTPFHGLGQLTPQQMASLADRRQRVNEGQKLLARDAWRAFCAPDPTGLEALLQPRHLGAALPRRGPAPAPGRVPLPRQRPLPQRGPGPPGTGRGRRYLRGPLRATQRMEERVFMGDSSFLRILRELASAPRPPPPPRGGPERLPPIPQGQPDRHGPRSPGGQRRLGAHPRHRPLARRRPPPGTRGRLALGCRRTAGCVGRAGIPAFTPLRFPPSEPEALPMQASRSVNRRLPIHLAVLLLLAAVPAAARPKSILDDEQFRLEAQRGLGLLYDMDFAAANAVFAGIAQHYPDHPVGPFLRALGPWWQIQVDPSDESQDDAFLDSMETVIDRCDKRLKKNRRISTACSSGPAPMPCRGRLHSDREHWLRAARDGQKALRYLQEVRKRDPENPDLLLGIGALRLPSGRGAPEVSDPQAFRRPVPQGEPTAGAAGACPGGGEGAVRLHRGGLHASCRSTSSSSRTTPPPSLRPLAAGTLSEQLPLPHLRGARLRPPGHLGRSPPHPREVRTARRRGGPATEGRRGAGPLRARPGRRAVAANTARPWCLRPAGEAAHDRQASARLQRSYGRLCRGMALDAMGQREEALC